MLDLKLFLAVLGVIFVAELPDKTALASLILATRQRPIPVFLGSGLALTVQTIVAVAAGRLIARLPQRPVHIGSGIVFLLLAGLMWRRAIGERNDPAQQERKGFASALWSAFAAVFLAEWGDLTQIATADFAARYRSAITVFLGAALALWAVAALAVFAGNRAGKLLDPKITQRVAAVVLACVGASLVVGWP